MKKSLLTLGIVAASIAGYAEVPAGLPTTLPDTVVGYELINDASAVTAGSDYIIRASFPAGDAYPEDVFLTDVTETIDGSQVSVAEFKALADIQDNPSSAYWKAEAKADGTWHLLHNGRYFTPNHGNTVTSGIIPSVVGTNSYYNLVQGTYTLTETNTCSWVGFVTPAVQSTAKDGLTSANLMQLSCYVTWNTSNVTRLMVYYRTATSTAEIGAGGGNTTYGKTGTTVNTVDYTTTSYYAVYHVITVAEKLAELKAEYKAKLSFNNEKAQQFGVDASAMQIDAITATTNAELTAAEERMKQIVENVGSISDDELNKAIIAHYNNRYILLKNARTDATRYLDMEHNTAGDFTAWSTDLSLANVWRMSIAEDAASPSGFKVSLYNPCVGKYCYTATQQNESGSIADETEGFVYFLAASDDGTKFEFVFPDITTYQYLYNNASVRAITWTQSEPYSQWELTFLTDEQLAAMYQTLKTQVAALTYADGTTTSFGYDDVTLYGDGLSQYKDPLGKSQAEFYTIVASAGMDEIAAVVKAYNTVTTAAAFDASEKGAGINMPAAGTYIRIHTAPQWVKANSGVWSTDQWPYLSSIANKTNGNGYLTAQFVKGLDADDNELSTILYYTGSGLAAYATGRCAVGSDASQMVHFNDDSEGIAANTPMAITFIAATQEEPGAYNVKYGTKDRYMYTNTGNYTDGGSSPSGSYGYNFRLETVNELPVTLTADGSATLCVPVAVKVPEGVDCYEAVVNGLYLNLRKLDSGAVVAKNTAIIVSGQSGHTVKFEIDYTADNTVTDPGFTGNYAQTLCNIEEGKLVYAPAVAPSPNEAPSMMRIVDADASASTVYFAQQTSSESVLPANAPVLTVDESVLNGAKAVSSFILTLNEKQTSEPISLAAALTSLSEVTAEQPAADVIYDIHGRRVTVPATRGLYIINGVKTLRK